MSVAICTVDPGHWHSSFGSALAGLLVHDAEGPRHVANLPGQRIWHTGGYSDVGTSRNLLIEAFLASGAEWLLWLDTDMSFRPTLIDDLLAVADPNTHPVVSALYFCWHDTNADHRPCSVDERSEWAPAEERFGWTPAIFDLEQDEQTIGGFVPITEYPGEALIPVDGVGLGCCLIHYSALLHVGHEFDRKWCTPLPRPLNLAAPWWEPRTFGEDLSLCLRLRACDIPIHVHTGIQAAHHKGPVVGTEATWRTQEGGRVPA